MCVRLKIVQQMLYFLVFKGFFPGFFCSCFKGFTLRAECNSVASSAGEEGKQIQKQDTEGGCKHSKFKSLIQAEVMHG